MSRIVCAFVVLVATSAAAAAPIAYSFTGTVSVAPSKPYGFKVGAATKVTGRFVYDPTSAATHALATGTGYEQHFQNGLEVAFDGVAIRSSGYLVQVSDNIAQPGGTTADIFSVVFSSALVPSLSAPLIVNDVSQTVGLFSLNFMGANSLWSGTAIPSSINLADFPTRQSLFADTPTGLVDVLFTVNSITQVPVPEPSSLLLSIIGAALVLYPTVRARRHKP